MSLIGCDIEQRGDPRHDVLAHRRGGGQQMRVGRRQRDQQRRHRLGQQVVQAGASAISTLATPGSFAAASAAASTPLPATSACTSPSFCGGRNSAARRLLDAGRVEFEQDEAVIAQITFASVRSFATSSATEPTFTPALRFGGSATFSVVSRGAGSTPRSAGFMLSIGFLRAFMMFGSEA